MPLVIVCCCLQVVPTSYTPLGANKTTISSNQFSVVGTQGAAGSEAPSCLCQCQLHIHRPGCLAAADLLSGNNDVNRPRLHTLCTDWLLLHGFRLRTSVRHKAGLTHCRESFSSTTSHPSRWVQQEGLQGLLSVTGFSRASDNSRHVDHATLQVNGSGVCLVTPGLN
jgi:hypothetical protein